MANLSKRSVPQWGRDLLTVPLRIAPAVWETVEALAGREQFSSGMRVLLNPQNAKPEDLMEFSERYLGLSNPFARFAVDVVMDPVNLFWGVGFSKGAHALKLHRTHPSRLVKPFINDFSGSGPGGLFRSFASHFDRQGWVLPRNADMLLNNRRTAYTQKFMQKYDTIRKTFRHLNNDDRTAWENRKGRVALLMDGKMRGKILNPTRSELWASEQLHTLFEDSYTMTALSEDVRKLKPEALASGVKDLPADQVPMGIADFFRHISGYLPRMARKQGMLEFDPEMAAHYLTKEASTYQGRVGAQLNVMGKLAPLDSDFTKAQGAARLSRHIESPGGRRVYNRFHLPRIIEDVGLTPEEFEKVFVIDLDKLVPEYVQRGGTTYALQVPLSAREATELHGRSISNAVPDVPNRISTLNRLYAQGSELGDEAKKRSALDDARKLSREIQNVPEQRSLYFQLAREGLKHTGFNVLDGKKGLLQMGRADRVHQAKLMDEYMKSITGDHDIYNYKISQGLATVFEKAGGFLDDPKIMALDRAGQVFGKKDVGKNIKDWLVSGQDLYTTVGRERVLTNWVYGSTLGFRLPSIILNLTQIPLVTLPHIGLGPTLHGIAEGGQRLAKTYRQALATRSPTKSWRAAFQEAAETHMPEFVDKGLLGELRTAEIGMDTILTDGLNKVVEASLLGFTGAENLNRVATFYGTRHMLRKRAKREPDLFGFVPKEPWEKDALIEATAANAVMETQFIPGAGRTARINSRLSPLTRQFSSYPIGFFNWMLDGAYRSGLDMMSQPVARALGTKHGRGRNYLPHARWLVAANMLDKGFGNILNVNLGEKAVSGVVNLPFADQPFAPLPLPPIPNLLVNAPGAVLDRDYDRLSPIELPWVGKIPIPKTLVPGGLALSQMSRWFNQTRDGFLLDKNERAIENVYKYEQWLEFLGFARYDSVRDRLKMRQLLHSQDRVKDYRRRLALSVSHGDLDGMRKAQNEYAKEFKDAPPLAVAPGDVKRVVNQMRTSKLQRVINNVSPVVRKRYGLFKEDDPAGFSSLGAELGVPQEIGQ